MKTLLSATALLAMVGTHLLAQDSKPAITVYPFGITQVAGNRDLANQSARRAIEGILATNRLAVKDSTASSRIQSALDAAGGLSQFNSPQQIERTKQLQSKYLLTGYVESSDTKTAGTDKHGKNIYSATMKLTLQLHDVEQGVVIGQRQVDLTNGMVAGAAAEDCTKGSFADKLKCRARQAARKAGDDKVRDIAESNVATGESDTPQKALLAAGMQTKEAVESFLNEGFSKGWLK